MAVTSWFRPDEVYTLTADYGNEWTSAASAYGVPDYTQKSGYRSFKWAHDIGSYKSAIASAFGEDPATLSPETIDSYADMATPICGVEIWGYPKTLYARANKTAAAIGLPAGASIVGIEASYKYGILFDNSFYPSACRIMDLEFRMGFDPMGSYNTFSDFIGNGWDDYTLNPADIYWPPVPSQWYPGYPSSGGMTVRTASYNFTPEQVSSYTNEQILSNLRFAVQPTGMERANGGGENNRISVTDIQFRIIYEGGSGGGPDPEPEPTAKKQTTHTTWY